MLYLKKVHLAIGLHSEALSWLQHVHILQAPQESLRLRDEKYFIPFVSYTFALIEGTLVLTDQTFFSS